jgi:hypothetical protein
MLDLTRMVLILALGETTFLDITPIPKTLVVSLLAGCSSPDPQITKI